LVDDRLLFDTGGDAPRLLSNLRQMGVDPMGIRAIVLSHAHDDHTGGLGGLLGTGVRPTVCVPRSFPAQFKADVRRRTTLVEVDGPQEILPGVRTTGEMGSEIIEQALVVETGNATPGCAGLVVITGCAHPGVGAMVRRAREGTAGEVCLVIGGFHLMGAPRRAIDLVIADFRSLGVRQAAPCHCTGDAAMRRFAEAYGSDFIPVGVGSVIPVSHGRDPAGPRRRPREEG